MKKYFEMIVAGVTGPKANTHLRAFSNPDFNYKSFRGNAVLRWEVVPGSVFYLVWSHDKLNYEDPGNFDIGRDFSNLWQSEANNVLFMKFSYWFDI